MPKNNAEFWTKWKKTTWKTFEETVGRGRNRSIKAKLVTDDDDGDDDDIFNDWILSVWSKLVKYIEGTNTICCGISNTYVSFCPLILMASSHCSSLVSVGYESTCLGNLFTLSFYGI